MSSKNKIVLRKIGGFYQTFDEDAYILYELFRYRIINGKCGFPVSAKNKVQNVLEEKKINYDFKIEEGVEEIKNFRKLNQYDTYVERGKNTYTFEKEKEKIKERIRDLPKEKVEHLLSYIEEYMNG